MNVALRPESLNLISLCTGGGGLDLGVELAIPSARSVVLVEREAFAASHLVSAMQQGLMAEAALWSDVTTFNGRPWRGLVDGLIGGIPCQPHSLAGKRLGEDDERDLWSDARRIIVQSGAWFVLIENVRGMLSSGGAERVWRDLQRLGFSVEGGLFTAAEVGASHERERIFILAVADPDRRQPQGRPAERREEGRRRPHRQLAGPGAGLQGVGVADAYEPGLEGYGQSGERAGELPSGSGGRELVHAQGDRRRERWTKSEFRRGRNATSSPSSAMGDTIGRGYDGRPDDTLRRSIERTLIEGAGERPDGSMADADLVELRRQPSARQQPFLQSDDGSGQTYLFPPSPSDLSSWRHILERAPELEPAFRRVADGLASRLDIARVDRLRMLGNGVVSLEAAYAVRTLATRLAASGSAGAARLVRMMELAA